MKVNILMPVYNIRKEELDRTMKSVLNQTYAEFTFLIVDDYSNDNKIDILRYYERLDSRVKIVNSEGSKGIIGALNEGIINIDEDCKYIARIDCGDICLRTRIEKQVKYMDKNPECAVVGTQFEAYCLDYPISDSIVRFQSFSNNICEFEDIKNNYTVMAMFVHSTLMFRKNAIQVVGTYSPQYIAAEDYEIIGRMISNGYKINKIPEVLVKYEFTPNKGISQENRIIQVKTSLKIKSEYIFDNFISNDIKRNVYIWGTKDFAGYLEEELRQKKYNVKVNAFTDFDCSMWGMIKNSLPIINPNEMINSLKKNDIIISMWNIDRENIILFLENNKLLRNEDYFVFS